MPVKYRSSILAVSVVVALVLSAAGPFGAAAQGQTPTLWLERAVFNPGRGEAPSIPPGLAVAGYAQEQRGYYIVQFGGPVEQAWKDELAALGAELLDYLPDFAFKVRMNPAQAARAASLGTVVWVGIFQPAFKLDGDLATAGTQLYKVRVERGAEAAQAAAAIAATGAQVLSQQGHVLVVAADAAQVPAVAQVVDVAWIENFQLPEKHNEYGGGALIGANQARAAGYDGSTQTVAVADTGLGGGTAATAHADIPAGRIANIYNWRGVDDSCWSISDDGAVDVDSGHGTHTAGSVLGDGSASGIGTGTAPAARLVFQAVENWATMKGLCAVFYPSGYYLTGLPADLRTLFQQAYNAGARVHSNSWGSAAAGDYTANSAYADQFVWANPDMAITFSAGNEGIDANGDGRVDNDSMGAPATAKNVITVGASENDRQGDWACDTGLAYTGCTGQNSLFTYGAAWPGDYPANPIAGDPSAGNAEQMAAFSSRGPTDDGRIKPDVVAPGTWVLSAYSDLYQQGYDAGANPRNGAWQYDGWGFPLNSAYKYMGGTSMSNPLVAGGAAVVRDYYQKAHGLNASAALVKATLINTAVDLLDENNDGANDNDFPIPNTHEGWGRVNLAAATNGSARFVEAASGLATGGTATYNVSVAPGNSPLKISLAWSDYPSTEAAAINLVNDLDLIVTGPNGAVYQGNVFGGGWSATGGTADRRNNVENVYVPAAAAGTYTVQVRGFNVPQGSQPYALVVTGGTLEAGTPPTPTTQPTATTPPTATPVPPTATPAPAVSVHVGDLDGTSAMVNRNNWRATVTITVHDAAEAPVAGVTVTGGWSGGATGTATCVTGSAGACSVTSSNLKANKASATFTVSSLSGSGFSYVSSANHETSITVLKP